MPRDPLIGLVGKPSSGKSTTLNSLTDASSKVGNFPFTTIDPQRAIGYLQVPCACARHGLQKRCKPNHGACVDGTRTVPIELLDVAGLVPGAHEGKGLGNKFLDDLRHADALIHVVDTSGTTDAEGKATRGYDPTRDVVWLREEIEQWILGNLKEKWGSTKRRHVAIKATAVETLAGQLSGYGANPSHIAQTLDLLNLKTRLESWDDETLASLVRTFVSVKFPTVLALNKIDHPDADANVARIAKANPNAALVLTSAIAEVFLRKLVKQRYVKYIEGSDIVDTREDLIADGDPNGGDLLEMDDKLRQRLENLRDMVLFRFGSTGVVQVLSRAAEVLGLVPVFPVRNISTFTAGSGSAGDTAERAPVFRDCVLVKKGITVRGVANKVIGDAPLAYVEGVGGTRVAETEVVGVDSLI